ncbi:hypothetical protein KC660_04690 [Candidatus Dojkabacteria bacterium]|uniref:Uncharacterized protein n=1 Tax=Candidatus Dojkabacteria bacterium TaxID=2099670 RepID=A0A955L4V7_9BACT|nr:hypothetical protein [Candidatus Dojkabacteria bacterium]
MSRREESPQPADPSRREFLRYGLPLLGPGNSIRHRSKGEVVGGLRPAEMLGYATTALVLAFAGKLEFLPRVNKEAIEVANRISDQVLSIDHMGFSNEEFENILGGNYDPEILAHGRPSIRDLWSISPQTFERMAKESKITLAAVALSDMFTEHAKFTGGIFVENLARVLNIPSKHIRRPRLDSIDKVLSLEADTNSLGIDLNLHVSAEMIATMISEQDRIDIANGRSPRAVVNLLQVGVLKALISNKGPAKGPRTQESSTVTVTHFNGEPVEKDLTSTTSGSNMNSVPSDGGLEYLDDIVIEVIEPYSPLLPGELQKEGLLDMISLAKKFPDKLFLFTAGNFNSDFADLREELESSGDWADNIILVGAAYQFNAAYKPSERLTGSRGADFYLEVPSRSSSEATALMTSLSAIIKDQNPSMSPPEIIKFLQKYTEEITLVRKGLLVDTYGVLNTLSAEGEMNVRDIPDQEQFETYVKDDYDFVRFQGRILDVNLLRNDLMKGY